MNWAFYQSSGRADALAIDVLGALLVHAIYHKYELDPVHLLPTALLLGGIPTATTYYYLSAYPSACHAALVSFTVFFATLVSSIILYRISPFHPLAKYPGPFLAKISKFYAMWQMSTGRYHHYYFDLHKCYGPFVRVGPNQLAIVDAKYVTSIHGASGLPKGPMWDARRNPHAPRNLPALRNPHEHARRRKPWTRAFSSSAIKDYEPTVIKRVTQLIETLQERSKGDVSLDLAIWMRYYAFDFMGDLLFGGGFETMRYGTEDVAVWNTVEGGMKQLAIIQHIPWIMRFLYLFPGSTKALRLIRHYSSEAVRKRKAMGSNVKDAMYYMIDEDGQARYDERPTEAELLSDAFMAIVAGYDTTSVVLAQLFYGLLCHREDYARLLQEIDEYFPPEESFKIDNQKLTKMPFLNAVVNEALRTGFPGNVGQRGTTPATGGRWYGENYVPVNTAVDTSFYTLLRDPKNFSPAPEAFWPDRFLPPEQRTRGPPSNMTYNSAASKHSLEEVVVNMDAFIPFSLGPANCVGKNLALLELRLVPVLVLRHLNLRLTDGYNPDDWERDKEDWYVMKTSVLPVVVTPRE